MWYRRSFKFWLCHLLALEPEESHSGSVGLHFLNLKTSMLDWSSQRLFHLWNYNLRKQVSNMKCPSSCNMWPFIHLWFLVLFLCYWHCQWAKQMLYCFLSPVDGTYFITDVFCRVAGCCYFFLSSLSFCLFKEVAVLSYSFRVCLHSHLSVCRNTRPSAVDSSLHWFHYPFIFSR